MNYNLFTGNTFPEKVFNIDLEKVIVFEFDILFRDLFTRKLTEFCKVNYIEAIKFESLDKQYPLEIEIKCDEIEKNYTKLLKNTFIKEELPNEITYYILLSNFIFYSNKSSFAFYASRDFEVGILAYNNDINITMFKELVWGVTMDYAFTAMHFNKAKSQEILNQFAGKEYFFNYK